jgi:NADH-quinone oxidoreductase subunit G
VIWFDAIPSDGSAYPAGWRVVPLYHVFGSEELSARSPPVMERIPAPYVALHPADISLLDQADSVEIDWSGFPEVLPVRPDDTLVRGSIGIPAGLPGIPSGPCPRRVAVRRAQVRNSEASL